MDLQLPQRNYTLHDVLGCSGPPLVKLLMIELARKPGVRFCDELYHGFGHAQGTSRDDVAAAIRILVRSGLAYNPLGADSVTLNQGSPWYNVLNRLGDDVFARWRSLEDGLRELGVDVAQGVQVFRDQTTQIEKLKAEVESLKKAKLELEAKTPEPSASPAPGGRSGALPEAEVPPIREEDSPPTLPAPRKRQKRLPKKV